MERELALRIHSIAKRYGSTQALIDLNLTVQRGEVHAILGENGAGKSTLIKILSGAIQPDTGVVSVASGPVKFRRPRNARDAGIATAFQELTLVPQLSVAQNLMLGKDVRNKFGLVTYSVLAEESRRLLAEWDLESIDVEGVVEGLPLGVQQQIELVRTLGQQSDIVLLDEPTAALGATQVDWLFRQIARIKGMGKTVIFISHRMGEVREICDSATVLRGGTSTGTFVTGEIDDSQVMQMMLGHDVERVLHPGRSAGGGEPIMVVGSLTDGSAFHDVNLSLRAGEVAGLAALQGHGQYELFMTLFGARRSAGGSVTVHGKEVRFKTPRDAINSGLGISLVPEDRKTEGIILSMSGVRNVTLPNVRRLSRFGFMRTKAERAQARDIFEMVNVRLSALDSDVSALSGGNQQKLAIGKWLKTDSRCVLLYDPTRGVDVGTKAEIFSLMHRQSDAGAAVFFYSTDIEELLAVSHRVFVMYRGTVVANFSGDELTRTGVLSAMLGQAKANSRADDSPIQGKAS